jgi:hypothetical protein
LDGTVTAGRKGIPYLRDDYYPHHPPISLDAVPTAADDHLTVNAHGMRLMPLMKADWR